MAEHPEFARAAALIVAVAVRDTLVEMVDIASPTGREGDFARHLVERMRRSGCCAWLQKASAGRPNAIASHDAPGAVRVAGERRSMMEPGWSDGCGTAAIAGVNTRCRAYWNTRSQEVTMRQSLPRASLARHSPVRVLRLAAVCLLTLATLPVQAANTPVHGSTRPLQMRADVPPANPNPSPTTFGYPGVRSNGYRRPVPINAQQPGSPPAEANFQRPADNAQLRGPVATPRDGSQYNIISAPAPTQSFAGTSGATLQPAPALSLQPTDAMRR